MTKGLAVSADLNRSIFNFLRPVFKSFGLAYTSVVGPKLLNVLYSLRKRESNLRGCLLSVYCILLQSCAIHDFPFFCGLVVGGYTFLQIPFMIILAFVAKQQQPEKWRRHQKAIVLMSRSFSALCSAWFSLSLLNDSEVPSNSSSGTVDGSESIVPREKQDQHCEETRFSLAGKSKDLTLFTASRAIDTLLHELWTRRKRSRLLQNRWTAVDALISRYTDAMIFAASSGAVMWAWFYLPDRLPRTYKDWINAAAQVDERLIEALRRARHGQFIYGKDTGQAPLLKSMCKNYGWPLEWGDPAVIAPIPCEMVHMGAGPSCHWHAIVRFARAFKFALAMYLPLQLVLRATHPSFAGIRKACREAARSSAFLGAFVALFYYGVCLSRTRLGPKIISRERISPMMWDAGLCVRAGCLLCGWSILVEAEKRRQELALFIVPRAAATFFPRRYSMQHFWKEKAVFSVSTAMLFAFAHEDPGKVRGVLGGILHNVLEA